MVPCAGVASLVSARLLQTTNTCSYFSMFLQPLILHQTLWIHTLPDQLAAPVAQNSSSHVLESKHRNHAAASIPANTRPYHTSPMICGVDMQPLVQQPQLSTRQTPSSTRSAAFHSFLNQPYLSRHVSTHVPSLLLNNNHVAPRFTPAMSPHQPLYPALQHSQHRGVVSYDYKYRHRRLVQSLRVAHMQWKPRNYLAEIKVGKLEVTQDRLTALRWMNAMYMSPYDEYVVRRRILGGKVRTFKVQEPGLEEKLDNLGLSPKPWYVRPGKKR